MTSRPSGFQLTKTGRLRLYSTRELLNLPAPEWLIDGIIPKGGLIGVYGPPGEGKSFVAIDLAMAVATSTPWHGHRVAGGFCIYIAAEGGVGITKRVRARLAHYAHEPADANIAWLTETISVNNDADDLDRLFERIDDEIDDVPVLIIIDTLARCFDGNENEQEDMGRFIAGVDRMRLEYGATVVIIHHTNVSGARERGNTAFRGAADTMIAIRRNEDTSNIEVVCNKQKDAEDFPAKEFTLQILPQFESAVIVPAAQLKSDIVYGWISLGPCRFTDLKARCEEEGSPISLATLKRKLRELTSEGKIVKNIEGIYDLPNTEAQGSQA